jgi:ribonuclease-3
MAKGQDILELETALGYTFRDPELLCRAMTHSSYANEQRAKGRPIASNERLEFLGDAVLELTVSQYLFLKYPKDAEGDLTRIRQQLVCEETLARVAERIGLGAYLSIGKGEEQSGSRSRPSILADAMEALIAAIHLDSSGEADERILLSLLRDEIAIVEHLRFGDYKTRLQQLVQQDGKEELTYRVVREDGPEHNKHFEVEALINSNVVGRGSGKSKRDAEQTAAKEALVLFGVSNKEERSRRCT